MAAMKPLRIYVDTSVIAGCFDKEFSEESAALIGMAVERKAILLVSDVLAAELSQAPAHIRERLASLPADAVERVEADEDARVLQEAYLRAGVVGRGSSRDALHVATATVARADMIVSWNFRHIVHYEKIRGFNAVNYQHGFPMMAIHSPKEVI